EGQYVSLEPLLAGHAPLLLQAAGPDAEEIFCWIPYPMRTLDEKWVTTAFAEQDRGESAVCYARTTHWRIHRQHSLHEHQLPNRRVEIGSTWIIPRWQRTAVNTEAKYLMLRHAFETLGCIRVEFKTDALNQKSRAAILRLGAKQKGT